MLFQIENNAISSDLYLFRRVPAKAESAQIQEKWHTSYHGTQVDLIRRILDGGDLLKQGYIS